MFMPLLVFILAVNLVSIQVYGSGTLETVMTLILGVVLLFIYSVNRRGHYTTAAWLMVGDMKLTALFIAPVDKAPGDGLAAGCLRIDEPTRPATDAPLKLEGGAVRE
jgi:hypothetical protein